MIYRLGALADRLFTWLAEHAYPKPPPGTVGTTREKRRST